MGNSMTLTELKAKMPGIGSRLPVYGPALIEAMAAAHINTPLREAHFIAQIGHETNNLLWTEELASGAKYEGRRDLGNVHPGDGPRFKGRGFLQLTGRANYVAYGQSIGRDLEADPAAVSREPALCVGVATWFWTKHGLNALADEDDLVGITRRINGGTNGLPERKARLEVALTAVPHEVEA